LLFILSPKNLIDMDSRLMNIVFLEMRLTNIHFSELKAIIMTAMCFLKIAETKVFLYR
jgi:hypothetical protein